MNNEVKIKGNRERKSRMVYDREEDFFLKFLFAWQIIYLWCEGDREESKVDDRPCCCQLIKSSGRGSGFINNGYWLYLN